MQSNSNPVFFTQLHYRQRLLNEHGFDVEPTDDELMCYLFRTNDKLDLLANAIGYSFTNDCRGRVQLIRADASRDSYAAT